MTLPLPFQTNRAALPDTADKDTKLAWLRLIRTKSIGPVTFYQLMDTYGTADKALKAIPELARRGGRKNPPKIPSVKTVAREYNRLKKIGGELVLACEKAYPLALSALDDGPPVLTIRGNRDLMAKACFGIVGARNASMNGRKFARKIARDLGEAGQIIVSGLARGIDTAAHEGARDTGTIAVVAGGIDVVYPPENLDLYENICETGLVVAESPVGQKPFARSFPARNRIVSGLSSGVLVVEATKRSGSLITARLAGEQGRDVYAIPGHPYDPRAAGPNYLIRDGATLVRKAADILETVQDFSGGYQMQDSAGPGFASQTKSPSQPAADKIKQLSETIANEKKPADNEALVHDIPDEAETADVQTRLTDKLSFTPIRSDDLIRDTGIPAALVQTALLELEMAGRISRLPGNRVVLVKEEN